MDYLTTYDDLCGVTTIEFEDLGTAVQQALLLANEGYENVKVWTLHGAVETTKTHLFVGTGQD